MSTLAQQLADWATTAEFTDEDRALAHRSLVDTIMVAHAAADERILGLTGPLDTAGTWAVASHVVDFDDLHMESTSHISTVIIPVTLACGGDARAYLAGAGVMARLGSILGWDHYQRSWHATCSSGAPAAAVAAGMSMGLNAEQIAHAIALSVPAAGGVQRAFGTDGKSLQVGFACDAGVRAARLAEAGARADLTALESWLSLVTDNAPTFPDSSDAVPGGLAIKLYPCCYAMQRPISNLRQIRDQFTADQVDRIEITTETGTVKPLIHSAPQTGLEGKFSLEYSMAACILDDFPTRASFTDDAVQRPEAQALIGKVTTTLVDGPPNGLLAGECAITVYTTDGASHSTVMAMPPGSPPHPPTAEQMAAKAAGCGFTTPLDEVTFANGPELMRKVVS